MKDLSSTIWNLFRLVLALGFFGLLVVAVLYMFRGEMEAAAAMAALMSAVFFSINVTNFWQYRWEDADRGSKAVIIAPVVLSLAALGVSYVLAAPFGFSAVGVVVVFWFMVTRQRSDLRFSRVPVRLEMDDEGLRSMYGGMQMDSVAWADVVGVAVATEADGPFEDDLFFFLIEEDGEGCIVPNSYATDLMKRLQRLDGFDNEALIEVGTGTQQEPRTIWEGQAGDAEVCGESLDG